jgi:outer membrane protein assembly factor BamB
MPGVLALEPRTLLTTIDVLNFRDAGSGPAQYSNAGLDPYETTLSPGNVNARRFGKLATTYVDGQVYAQVLIETVTITVGPHPGIHAVAFVATENDSVYAIDANTGVVLWHDNFTNPAAGITAVPSVDTGADNITPEIGITSTPVINRAANVIYVMAETKQVEADGPHYIWTLHGINMSSGAEALSGPVVVADTLYSGGNYTYERGPSVAGQGAGSVGGVLTFNALRAEQRSALTLSHGEVFAAFASNGDIPPYHGWILGFNASTLSLSAVFNDTPNGADGGIWSSGAGLSVDPQGYLYVVTGNGTFDESLNAQGFPRLGDYGDSVVKLAIDSTSYPNDPNINGWGLKVVDYFTPDNQAVLDAQDLDLASGGVTILPASMGSATHPNLLIVAGKQGIFYLIDRNNMGKFDPAANRIVAQLNDGQRPIFSSPAVLGTTLYYAGVKGPAAASTISKAAVKRSAVSSTARKFAYPGATPMVSSNGSRNAVLWLLDSGANALRAYRANNLHQMLYSNSQARQNRDSLGQVVKFTVPTIANGKVYVGTFNSVVIYGLRSRPGPLARPRAIRR